MPGFPCLYVLINTFYRLFFSCIGLFLSWLSILSIVFVCFRPEVLLHGGFSRFSFHALFAWCVLFFHYGFRLIFRLVS